MSHDILDPPDRCLSPEDMPSYAYHEPPEPHLPIDDSELWKRIKALWAADDQEGLKKLYRELGMTNMRTEQA